MRLFIAIELPDEIKSIVLQFEKELSEFKDLRYVRPEHMHLTLSFIGEIPDKDVDAIRDRLGKINFNQFTLKTAGFGFFPSNKKIRVVWLGLEKNETFFKLQHDIRELFDHKEKFMPHITIARARNIITKDADVLNEAMKKIKYQDVSFQVEKFLLFKSELTPQGPIHTVLEEYDSVS
jgi:RNA 2',3'-cyclic 3'-phosphodiesterase